MNLLHPHRKCVVVEVWRNIIVSLLVLTRLLLAFQWSVKISWRMGLLEEQDDAIVGVFWPLFQSIEYIKCTLPALAATPLQPVLINH